MGNFDIVIVGAGHNGLVAAAYLARAGRKVLVLERRDAPGGQLAVTAFGPGLEAPALHPGASLRPDVVRELGLATHGLAADEGASDAAYISLLPGGAILRLASRGNDAATLESIHRLSPRDAARWPEFVSFMDTAAGFLDAAYRTPMPRMAKPDLLAAGLPLASLLLKLRRLGRRDMFGVMRSLSMTAREFTEGWFESEPLRAAIGALAIHGVTLGAMSAGTGYTLIHNWLNRGGLAHRGGTGNPRRIADALVAVLQAGGGQVRTSAAVAQVLVERQQVKGVRLENGEEIAAPVVLSAADPRHTLLGLVGAPELPPDFVWHAQSIRMRGSVAKVHVLTDGNHGLPAGTLVVAPTLKYLERACDAAKYGEISREPYLEVTTSGPVVSIHFQFAPHGLRQGDWSAARAVVEQRAIDTLAAHFPALAGSVREIRSITPLDLEREWGLTEGDLNHGQLLLDQVFFMRPMPGWSDHRTPVDGLYLCGSGVHAGGGISGASGRNAARAVLKAAGR
ncbi:MAG: NAD(P)/FAD-dependent oxidoreductase [Steroidobacteraceae bacterium]